MVGTCIECQFELAKYKCSNCYASYCSPGCWKTHKNGEDCKKPEKDDITPSAKLGKPYITDDTIPQEKLKNLSSSNELKQLLKDSLLQKLIAGVDASPDPYEAVQKAMQDPAFVQFVDLCLGMVEEPEVKATVNS